MTDFFKDESELGAVLVPRGPWTGRLARLFRRGDFAGIRLSASAGWNDVDVSFLADFEELRSVEIYSPNVRSLAPVAQLVQLRFLGVDCPALSADVDLGALAALRVLKVRWRPALGSSFAGLQLRHLNVVDYPERSLAATSKMRDLTELLVTSRVLESLGGVERLGGLRRLDLFRCPKLSSLAGVEDLAGLEELRIDSCRGIKDVRAVRELARLRIFELANCGQVRTLQELRNCRELEVLAFGGNTRIEDGDLGFVSGLPHLRELVFSGRRHYSHRRQDLLRGDAGDPPTT